MKSKLSKIADKAVFSRRKNILDSLIGENYELATSLMFDFKEKADLLKNQTKENVIFYCLSHVTFESFKRWSDLNYLTPEVILHYIRNNGIHIDVQAMQMTSIAGMNIDPKDIVDFILKYPKGRNMYLSELRSINNSFRGLFGFNISENFINQYFSQSNFDTSNVPF